MMTEALPFANRGIPTATGSEHIVPGSPAATHLPLSLLILFTLGCGNGGDRLDAPALSPNSSAQNALAQYDKNHDGYLDANELEACPALKGVLAKLDTNGDQRLSADEIAARLEYFREANIGVMTVGCTVYLDEKPLMGAKVEFIPESFMGPAIMPASGVSEKSGAVALYIEGLGLPGLHCGFYKVKVSKDNGKGQESLPARYNTQTTLGAEVAPDMREGLRFWLKKDAAKDKTAEKGK